MGDPGPGDAPSTVRGFPQKVNMHAKNIEFARDSGDWTFCKPHIIGGSAPTRETGQNTTRPESKRKAHK